MGITIHYRIAQEKGYLKQTLDHALRLAQHFQEQAKTIGLSVEINKRTSDHCLYVDVDGCETLAFEFKPMAEHLKESDWSASYWRNYIPLDHTGEHYEQWPEQKLLWCSGFCKTQFAKTVVAHRYVAEIIRLIAGQAVFAEVNDEADYYHTGDIEQAAGRIESNGALINSVGGMLAGLGWDKAQVVKGGETVIKPNKKKHA